MSTSTRPSFHRIYRNSSQDLSSLECVAVTSPERPRSIDNGDVQENSSRSMRFVSKQLSSASSDSDHNKDVFGYRNVLSRSMMDITAPVVISPVTISRYICVLIYEYVKGGDRLVADDVTKNLAMDQRTGDLALYDVFHRARAKSIIIKTALQGDSTALPVPPPPLSDLTDYFMKICVDSQMEYECSIITYIYLMRFLRISRGLLVFNVDTFKGVVLALMLLANKIWDDFAMLNSEYCSIFYGLTLHRVNELELSMLMLMRNELWVSRSEYAAAHFSVQELITKEEIERVRNMPSNKRVSVIATKTVLSRDKSRSVLSEASSAMSTGSEFHMRSSEEDGSNILESMSDLFVTSSPELESSLAIANCPPPAAGTILSRSRENAYGGEDVPSPGYRTLHDKSPQCGEEGEEKVGEDENARVGRHTHPIIPQLERPMPSCSRRAASFDTIDVAVVATSIDVSTRNHWSCCGLWPFRLCWDRQVSVGGPDEAPYTPEVERSKSYSDVGAI